MHSRQRSNATLVGVGAMVLALVGAWTPPVLAQTELATITANDAAIGDNFGQSASISGSYAIVGAPREGTSPSPLNAGAAYVFINSGGWAQQQALRASDRASNDQFGFSVAIDGDFAAVGAPFDVDGVTGSGSVYIFHRSGSVWTQTQKLLGTVRANGDRFGDSLALEGTRLVVGASQQTIGRGKAYVFQFNGTSWLQTALIAPGTLDVTDEFGLSVALSGNTIVVGARNDDGVFNNIANAGTAYVYVFNGSSWVFQGNLRASDASAGAQFGFAVSVSSNAAAIGAPGDSASTGAVYVFDRAGSTWTQSAKVSSAATTLGDALGNSVAIDGPRLVAGARAGFFAAGYVAIFQLSGSAWLEDTLTNPVSPSFGSTGFGTSVALEGALMLGGAPGSILAETGSATFYQIDPLPPPPPTDSDGDGLSDALELAIAAGGPCPSPFNPDSDGDGLSDGYENNFGPNICNPDSDGDGLLDGVEVSTTHTNPTVADSDGDGLNDGAEVNTHHTNPLNTDTDGDGLTDGAEVNTTHTNPLNADSDGDGLSDGAEVNTHHTNPNAADSDGDGLSDSYEINTSHTNPNAADSDGDGLGDSAEITTYHTNPNLADTDGDALSDGAEISLGTDPLVTDTDGDGLSDSLELAYGTIPINSDTDGDTLLDGQEVTLAAGSGCPSPTVADSDGDGLNDGIEHAAGLSPCNGDTDGDGLSDGAEENTYHTDPLDPDSDHDGLTDGFEVGLAAGGSCPSPLNADSDGDGISDGDEHTAGSGPCDTDSDDDGLSDANEILFGTNPLNPDTDGDGLLDGTEVDIAMGMGCPNPLVADSDGDTISDGLEVTHHTNPCSSDTDGDGIPDNLDPNPLVPGVPPGTLANLTLATAGSILDTSNTQFLGPNNNARLARKVEMAAHLALAAAAIRNHNYNAARALLTVVAQRTDGISPPPDWMLAGPAENQIHSDVVNLIALLNLL